MIPFQSPFFLQEKRNTTNANIRQEKLITKYIQNGGGDGEGVGYIKGVLLKMCH